MLKKYFIYKEEKPDSIDMVVSCNCKILEFGGLSKVNYLVGKKSTSTPQDICLSS